MVKTPVTSTQTNDNTDTTAGDQGDLVFSLDTSRHSCSRQRPANLRGLGFVDGFAIVGLPKPRDNKTFSGLTLDDALASRKMEPRCGLYIVDLQSGNIIHSLTMDGVVSELYDVAVLADIKQPVLLGPNSPELRTTVSIGEITN